MTLAPASPQKLFAVDIGDSQALATAPDAFGALRRVVDHDDDEGNYGRDEAFSRPVTVCLIGASDVSVLAWVMT